MGTILITGAFGQVGKRCAQILLERGRTVIAMDLRTDKTLVAQRELSAGAHGEALIPAYTDLLDTEAVRDTVETLGIEIVGSLGGTGAAQHDSHACARGDQLPRDMRSQEPAGPDYQLLVGTH